MSRRRLYPPSFTQQLRNLNTLADVTQFMNELTAARDGGQIVMRNGTYRKLWKQAYDRCDAIKRAVLVDVHGRPLV